MDEFELKFPFVGLFLGQHFPGHDSEGIDIRGGRVVTGMHALGSHVLQRPDRLGLVVFSEGIPAGDLANPEVAQLRRAHGCHEDVLGLNVAVDDWRTLAVHIQHGFGHVEKYFVLHLERHLARLLFEKNLQRVLFAELCEEHQVRAVIHAHPDEHQDVGVPRLFQVVDLVEDLELDQPSLLAVFRRSHRS